MSSKKKSHRSKSSSSSKSGPRDTFTVKVELHAQKATNVKASSKQVFVRLAKSRGTRKHWALSKKASVNSKKEAVFDAVSVTTHLFKVAGKFEAKDCYVMLCEDGGKPGEIVKLGRAKINLCDHVGLQSDGSWSDPIMLTLDRPSGDGGKTPRDDKKSRRVRMEVALKFTMLKLNHHRLTLVNEDNEDDAARATMVEVGTDDYMLASESSESEEMSEAPSVGDDDDFDEFDDNDDDELMEASGDVATTGNDDGEMQELRQQVGELKEQLESVNEMLASVRSAKESAEENVKANEKKAEEAAKKLEKQAKKETKLNEQIEQLQEELSAERALAEVRQAEAMHDDEADSALATELEAAKESTKKAEEKLTTLEEENKSLNEKIVTLETQVDDNLAELEKKIGKIVSLEKECETLTSEVELQEDKVSNLMKESASLQAEKERLESELDAHDAEASKSKQANEQQQSDQVVKLESLLAERAAELTSLQEAQTALQSDLESANSSRDAIQTELDEARAAHETLQSQLDAAAEAESAAKAELAKAQEALATAHEELETANATKQSLADKVATIEASKSDLEQAEASALSETQAELEARSEEVQTLTKQLEKVEEQVAELKASTKAGEEKVEAKEKELEEMKDDLDNVKEELRQANKDVDKQEKAFKTSEERIVELEAELTAVREDADESEQLTALRARVDKMSAERSEASQKVEELDEKAQQLVDELNVAVELQQTEVTRREKVESQLAEAETERDALSAQIKDAESQLQAAEEQRDELTARVTDLEETIEAQAQKLKNVESTTAADNEDRDKELDELEAELSDLKDKHAAAKVDLDAADEAIADAEEARDDALADVESLKSQLKDTKEELSEVLSELKKSESALAAAQNNSDDDDDSEKTSLRDTVASLTAQLATATAAASATSALSSVKKDDDGGDDDESHQELKEYAERLEAERDELESLLDAAKARIKSMEAQDVAKQSDDKDDDDDNSSDQTDNNNDDKVALLFDVELAKFLESQVYQTQMQFVQGSDCAQLASRVFYQLNEWHALDGDASNQARSTLPRTLAALRTVVTLLSNNSKGAAHALSSMTSLRRLVSGSAGKSKALPSHVVEFVVGIERLLCVAYRSFAQSLFAQLRPLIVPAMFQSREQPKVPRSPHVKAVGGSQGDSSSARSLTSILDKALAELEAQHVSASLCAQLSRAALSFIAQSVCNAVLGGGQGAPTQKAKVSMLATAQNGFNIKLEASVLDAWCANRGKEFADCREALAPALQLSTMLVMDKAILADPQVLKEICPELNVRQVNALVERYVPDDIASEPVPPGISKKLLAMAKKQEKPGQLLPVLFDADRVFNPELAKFK